MNAQEACGHCGYSTADPERLRAHQLAEHVPRATHEMYAEAFPNASEHLRESMAILHCLTAQHQDNRCCGARYIGAWVR